MNVFNRVLVVLLLLVFVVLVGVGAAVPERSLAAVERLVQAAKPLVFLPMVYLWWAVAAALIVLALLLLALELYRPRHLTVQVRQASGGVVELSTESVSRSLEYHIRQVPGVNQVRPQVESRGRSVRVALELETDPLADVPAKSEEVMQLARELVEGKLGLKMAPGGLRVQVRQGAYRQGGGVAQAVQPPELPLDLPGEAPTEGTAS